MRHTLLVSRTKSFPRLSALTLAIASLSFGSAQAAQFSLGDVNVNVDSQISFGSSWRMESRNNDYIAAGTLGATGTVPGLATNPQYQGNASSNTDNGNMNFDRGDAFSQVIQGNHQLSFSHQQYRNMGANLSFRYWYDGVLDGLDGAPENARMVRDYKGTTAFDDARRGIDLQDAYIWGEFELAGRPAQVIFGRHVLNWGESTFIQGGQNAANPIDVPALRRPGAEIRDGLLPVTMLSGSIALDEAGAWTVEGYYQFEWQRTRADACGTYFSNNDFAAEGCGPVYYQSGLTEQANAAGSLAGTPFAALAPAYAGLGLDSRDLTIAARASDNEPSNTGQFGVSLKWYAEQLNGTEFGISFQNVHSRLPVVGGNVSAGSDGHRAMTYSGALQQVAAGAGLDLTDPVQAQQAAVILQTNPTNSPAVAAAQQAITASGLDDPTEYIVEFPEDLQIFAASFATLLPTGTAWSGEFTYRPNTPIQINANDVLVRGLLGNLGYDPNNPTHNASHPIYGGLLARLPTDIQEFGSGMQKGYLELDVYQFQSTFIHDINRVMGAENLRLIGEVGFTYVNDLPDINEVRLGRSSIYGSSGSSTEMFADNGYVTDFSWGYRLVAQLEYNNAFIGGLTLKPTFSWSHDVNGYGPEPGAQFYEGRMILGTELAAEYMNTYWGRLGYTHYFDTDYWDLDDRSFISLSVGMDY
ncbi:DUF1302 domain-containing protein [Marinospirillum sp. MEB164]|uniref:DUF1302 domain-containing protein n=1 Tax=Marinospirillum alkalitolerans TaxID=3123374 RepID=A0ABW8PWD7_9GAMM